MSNNCNNKDSKCNDSRISCICILMSILVVICMLVHIGYRLDKIEETVNQTYELCLPEELE